MRSDARHTVRWAALEMRLSQRLDENQSALNKFGSPKRVSAELRLWLSVAE
jgi:hypothetical protein